MLKTLSAVVIVLIACVGVQAGTKQLTFEWQKTEEADLAGFLIEKSTDETNWTAFADVPYQSGVTDYTQEQPIESPDGEVVTYYFRILAYDGSGNRSDWTYGLQDGTKCKATIDFLEPSPAVDFSVTVTVTSGP